MMCTRRAKSAEELKKMIVELEARRKRMEELGRPPDDYHTKSILASMLDEDTNKHTVESQSDSTSYEQLKAKVMGFVNAVSREEKVTKWT